MKIFKQDTSGRQLLNIESVKFRTDNRGNIEVTIIDSFNQVDWRCARAFNSAKQSHVRGTGCRWQWLARRSASTRSSCAQSSTTSVSILKTSLRTHHWLLEQSSSPSVRCCGMSARWCSCWRSCWWRSNSLGPDSWLWSIWSSSNNEFTCK